MWDSYSNDPNKEHLCDEAVEFCVAFRKHVKLLKKAGGCCGIIVFISKLFVYEEDFCLDHQCVQADGVYPACNIANYSRPETL